MRRSRRAFRGLGLLAISTMAAFGAADDLSIRIRPVFDGLNPGVQTYPILVDLANLGPDARGVVTVSTGSFTMNYPVELPRGAQKRLTAYPMDVQDMGEAIVSLKTDQGNVEKRFHSDQWNYMDTRAIAMITDAPGQLTFMRQNPRRNDDNATRDAVSDAYVSPETAPDRPTGYASLAAVILGDGAERLSDAQVRALQTWTLAGGKVVFVGGASSPVLEDKRWADFLPISHPKPGRWDSQTLSKLMGVLPGQALSVTVGDLAPGATVPPRGRLGQERFAVIEKPVGVGQAIFWAFNPFESPLDRAADRRAMVMSTLRPIDNRGAARLSPYLELGESLDDGTVVFTLESEKSRATMAKPLPTTAIIRPAPRPARDPFSAKPPPIERVLIVLVAFFLVAVPLNFLVLRKLKRGELAWVTAPLISLGFGGYFLASAGDLYSAQLSIASSGVLIGSDATPNGYFLGRTQLFFPRGGNYDMGFRGVDQVSARSQDPYEYRYRGGYGEDRGLMKNLGLIDVGEVKAPKVSVGNLSFSEYTFRQVIPTKNWFQLDGRFSTDDKGIRFTGKLTNKSPYTLTAARIVALPMVWAIKDRIAPGETVSVSFNSTIAEISRAKQEAAADQSGSVSGLQLEADLQKFRPGAQIGEVVEGRSQSHLIYSFSRDLPKVLQ